MKKYYPGPALALAFCIRIVLIAVVILASAFLFSGQAQQGLEFKNPALDNGTAGQNGAVYRFSSVANNVDALVTINGRSNGLVKLVNIDKPGVGHDKAFQPQVTYNNNTTPNGISDWWMEFRIQFVKSNTNTPVAVSAFDITAIDIDGNGDKLNEWVCFYDLKTSMFEANTMLQSITLLDYILGLLTPVGKKFTGPTRNYVDVDTSATTVMATTHYENSSVFKMRVGGHATSSQGAADRMYSFWFKAFTYQAPVQSTLPVKLSSFNARKNDNKVELTWSTSMEKNVSHFVIERSTNGTDYSDVGMLFTNGDSEIQRDYKFNDDVKQISKGVIYYRLKIVDLDARFEYSPVRVIKISTQNQSLSVLAFPNPVTGNLRITLPTAWQDAKITIDMVNTNGQVVKRIVNNRANQTETLNVSDLSVGIYMVRVSNGSETAIQRIVKTK
jgi:hypothetical protein